MASLWHGRCDYLERNNGWHGAGRASKRSRKMYIDTYQHPYELQRDDVGARENLTPNGQREETIAPMRLCDEAGRVPYEDIC